MTLAFGPVPSRRLGRSLGINNIPPKTCSYSCVYCQLGPTGATERWRRSFFTPAQIAQAVRERVERLRARGEKIDYLTFVPDGEPTLDTGLAEEIGLLRPLGIPIAVISNASLLSHQGVRDALGQADWVSVRVDAADAATWSRINRPKAGLRHDEILAGLKTFARIYPGTLVGETMLVDGVNDDEASGIAARVSRKRLTLECKQSGALRNTSPERHSGRKLAKMAGKVPPSE